LDTGLLAGKMAVLNLSPSDGSPLVSRLALFVARNLLWYPVEGKPTIHSALEAAQECVADV
jgi:hypothetical protein